MKLIIVYGKNEQLIDVISYLWFTFMIITYGYNIS